MLANANIAIVGEFVVVILVCGWAGMIVVAVAAKRLATDPDDLRTGMARLGLMPTARRFIERRGLMKGNDSSCRRRGRC